MSRPAPSYAAVDAAYPRKPKYDWPTLFHSIGWDDLVGNFDYYNTCATRVSIALLGAGYHFPGRMKIKAGPLKDKMIEPGQRALSMILARRDQLGTPEKYTSEEAARQGIGNRHGIVSFFRINAALNANDRQGHIDLISPARGGLMCAGACYMKAAEIWFWPLP